jgi:23S rRNA (cytosine1962-C5)-methyltransferase
MNTAPSDVTTAQLIVKPRKAAPFHGRHPWVLDTAIARVEGEPADGDVVELISDKGKWIARGIFNSQSRIRARLYSWTPSENLDESFWRQRLLAAIALRRQLGYEDFEGAERLVYSEGDGLSGLIVDRYGEYLAVQVTALAVARRLDAIIALLVDLLRPKGVLIRTERGVAQAEGIDLRDGIVWGEAPSGPVFIREHGLRYGVDLGEGQKTGFYLDQRENRRVAARYLAGRRVLDMCCYSGGFSLAASKLGGAASVLGIDTSQKAVALAEANAALNEVANVRFQAGDVFDALDAFAGAHERYGAVILDPPKFARSRQAVDDALRAYHRLNRRAVDLLEPGGMLITCSCSGHVTREDFLFMLVGVAQKTGRDLQILEQRGAAPDHPVAATCLETEYLKCFVCRVG